MNLTFEELERRAYIENNLQLAALCSQADLSMEEELEYQVEDLETRLEAQYAQVALLEEKLDKIRALL